eukprot:4866329-Prymnesium_polylepis.1
MYLRRHLQRQGLGRRGTRRRGPGRQGAPARARRRAGQDAFVAFAAGRFFCPYLVIVRLYLVPTPSFRVQSVRTHRTASAEVGPAWFRVVCAS